MLLNATCSHRIYTKVSQIDVTVVYLTLRLFVVKSISACTTAEEVLGSSSTLDQTVTKKQSKKCYQYIFQAWTMSPGYISDYVFGASEDPIIPFQDWPKVELCAAQKNSKLSILQSLQLQHEPFVCNVNKEK